MSVIFIFFIELVFISIPAKKQRNLNIIKKLLFYFQKSLCIFAGHIKSNLLFITLVVLLFNSYVSKNITNKNFTEVLF